MNYLMPTRYKLRKSSPKKNIISVLLFALSRLKIKEISYFKGKTLEKPATFLQTACIYCSSKRDQKGTKTLAKPVFSREPDWQFGNAQPYAGHCVWMGP